jgi:glycosyltransferase involved in cell wall biosynthesis
MVDGAKISVVIATCNRLSMLRNCLSSLERQQYPKDLFEVVVIDDGSTDGTGPFLRSHVFETTLRLRVFSHPNRGVSCARNNGMDKAVSDIIAFTDDDCILPADWLNRLSLHWDEVEEDIAGIGGPLDTVTSDNDSFVSQYLAYIDEFNYIPVLKAGLVRPVHVSHLTGREIIPYLRTSNASFRKSCLLEVGGFASDFHRPGGEDPDLCYRMLAKGYRFHFMPDLVVQHVSRESMKAYFKSLGNYVRGEYIKNSHIDKYPVIIRNTYRCIFCQKILSVLISIVTLPISVLRSLNRRRCSLVYGISFPFVVCASKVYALTIAFRHLFEREH